MQRTMDIDAAAEQLEALVEAALRGEIIVLTEEGSAKVFLEPVSSLKSPAPKAGPS